MKKVTDVISMTSSKQIDLKQSYVTALKDPNFRSYVEHLPIEEDLLMKYTSRLEEASQEFQNCLHCPGLENCKNHEKGFLLTPEKQLKSIVFSYNACAYLKKQLKQDAYQENVYLFEIPKQIKNARMKDIYKDDRGRKELIKYLIDFLQQYPTTKKQKGLYLNGSFGSGKTYLVAALFNELAKQKVRSALIYYPEFLRSLKESFGNEEYREKFDRVKKAPLLLLDDIGAENMTPWSRDEVLGPLLQYRMNEELPTFFTSNLTMEELESHLANSNNAVEKVKARRIIERIKELSLDMKLISKNRRS